MRAELKTHGLNLTGSAGFNAVTDPDGIRMQFMATPGGLLPTIIASTRVTQDDAICEAVGLDHVVLQVPDLEKSAGFYRKFFGKETARDRSPGAHLVHGRAYTAGAGEGAPRVRCRTSIVRDPRGRIRPPGRHPQTGRDRRHGAAVHGLPTVGISCVSAMPTGSPSSFGESRVPAVDVSGG